MQPKDESPIITAAQRAGSSGGPAQRVPVALVAAVVLACGLAWWQYLVWMVTQWSRSEYYGHGFLIPLISGYLIYRRRSELASLPREGHGGGLVILGGCLIIYLLGLFMDVNFVQGFAFVGTIWGLVWWLRGWPTARAVVFPVAYLLFMVPLERVLVDRFAQPLQLNSSLLAGSLARFLGMPVVIEGTKLHLPDYTFEVAIACSGLKTAIALSALGALVAYLLTGPLWRRLLLFGLSVPIALLANTIRIWLTLVLGGSLGPQAADGFFHSASGVLVFLLAVGGLLGVGRLLGCHHMREEYLIAAVLLAVVAVAVPRLRQMRIPPQMPAVDFSRVPLKLAGFEGRQVPVDEETRGYLHPDAMVSRIYQGPVTASVALIYARDWREIHNPATCFPAQGWLIVSQTPLDLPAVGPQGEPVTLRARWLVCTKGKDELVAVFLFAYPGGTTADWASYGWNVLRHRQGGLILTTQAVAEKGREEEAARQLGRLVAAMYPPATSFWR